jgi:hypothetical protein
MRLPRIRIWILMTVVALAALASTGWVMVRRSREYLALAVMHEKRARSYALARQVTYKYGYHMHQMAPLCRRLLQLLNESQFVDPTRQQQIDYYTAAEKRLKSELVKAEQEKRDEQLERERLRKRVPIERALAVRYRRAARYPWLGAPRVKPESE